MRAIWIMIAMVAMTGCASLKNTASTALTIGGAAKPEYAAAIDQIQKLLRGGPINPVEGFDFDIIWRYEGVVLDSKELTQEVRFSQVKSADDARMVTIIRNVDELTAEDQALKDQIERILEASGVIDE